MDEEIDLDRAIDLETVGYLSDLETPKYWTENYAYQRRSQNSWQH